MKNKILWILMSLILSTGIASADNFVNLTPRPRAMTVLPGEVVLPQDFVVGYNSALSAEMVAEVQRFVLDFNAATGYNAVAQADAEAPLFDVALYGGTMNEGAYNLTVNEGKVAIRAKSVLGFYYAFQSVKKILPANVMAGKQDAAVTKYALPCVTIQDEPRFAYRGFMLDVARHFFTVEEVKRMLDVMSYYKMNRFHWHLTDDQGWRVEIKQYPKLTTIGATASNTYVTDLEYGPYWTNQVYGPYFYTQEQIKDVVAYAKERHIEVIPEVDMPGHFVAAMASYPEYCCHPESAPSVWINGGISSDVLNVANPAAVQFAKNILAELIPLFPYDYFHIGGDECPTSQWESNAECQAKYRELGLTNYRQLQSHFIKEMADFLKEHGKKTVVWNEAITAGNADTELIKETGATVFCWQPAVAGARKAAELGLDNVFTPWGPYYINRKQSNDAAEATLPGNGSDNVQNTYSQEAVPTDISAAQAAHYTGVQGTFWTEHVADRNLMEYLALPRLMAIAEAGWTPKARKDFADFQKRITADTLLLNYGGYNYGRHYILTGEESGGETGQVMPKVSTAESKTWYRLITRATGERAGKCIELLREGSPLISQYSGKNAAANRLWTNAQAAEGDAAYDYQFWGLEEDSAHPGHYALVCKAVPAGSVNPNATAQNNTGRWNYDVAAKNYNFVLADHTSGYGRLDNGNYYYSIRCDQTENLWMNASLGGQGYAVNLYGDPADGNGGLWEFAMLQAADGAADAKAKLNAIKAHLANAKTYATAEAKAPGLYGATEKQELEDLIKNVDPEALTAAELETFVQQLDAKYAAFLTSFGYLEEGKAYRFANAVEAFAGTAIVDDGESTMLRHAGETWQSDAWLVTKSTVKDDGTQSVQLKNAATGRFISTNATKSGSVAYPVYMGTTAGNVTLTFNPANGDYTLALTARNFFPVAATSGTLPGIISSGSTIDDSRNAIRPQGAAWNVEQVYTVAYVCKDTEGNIIGTYVQSAPAGKTYTCAAPEIKNHSVKTYELTGTAAAPEFENLAENKTVNVTYQRSAYSISLVSRDQYGAIIDESETSCPVGESFSIAYPELPYYTYESSDYTGEATFAPTGDMTINAVYTTNAVNGVKRLGKEVTAVEAGKSYVIYDDCTTEAARKGYRMANAKTGAVVKDNNIEDTTPYYTWTLEASGTKFKVLNNGAGKYVPSLKNSTAAFLSNTGDSFAFTRNADGSWKIKGSNNVCWDGLAAGALVGYNDPGHPYRIYEYYAQPYFSVTVNAVDEKTSAALATTAEWVKAGETYTLVAPTIEGYFLKSTEGDEGLSAVDDNTVVTLTYATNDTGIEKVESGNADAPAAIYDLSGRRLGGISRSGIYIVNGRKVLVK